MASSEVLVLVEKFVAAASAHDAQAFVALYAPDATVESPSTGLHRGADEIRSKIERWFLAFPDLQLAVDDVIGEENKVAASIRLAGTHKGEFFGFPPTGKHIEFRMVVWLNLENGLITRDRRVYDFSGFLIKLGMLKVKPS